MIIIIFTLKLIREGHSICVLQNRYLLIMGGWNSDNEEICNEIWLFDTS